MFPGADFFFIQENDFFNFFLFQITFKLKIMRCILSFKTHLHSQTLRPETHQLIFITGAMGKTQGSVINAFQKIGFSLGVSPEKNINHSWES